MHKIVIIPGWLKSCILGRLSNFGTSGQLRGRQKSRLYCLALCILLTAFALLLHSTTRTPSPAAFLDVALYVAAGAHVFLPRICLSLLVLGSVGFLITPVDWLYVGEYAAFVPIMWRDRRIGNWIWGLYSVAVILILTCDGWLKNREEGYFCLVGWTTLLIVSLVVSVQFRVVEKRLEQAKFAALRIERAELLRRSRLIVAENLESISLRCKQDDLLAEKSLHEIRIISETATIILQEMRSMQQTLGSSNSIDSAIYKPNLENVQASA